MNSAKCKHKAASQEQYFICQLLIQLLMQHNSEARLGVSLRPRHQCLLTWPICCWWWGKSEAPLDTHTHSESILTQPRKVCCNWELNQPPVAFNPLVTAIHPSVKCCRGYDTGLKTTTNATMCCTKRNSSLCCSFYEEHELASVRIKLF